MIKRYSSVITIAVLYLSTFILSRAFSVIFDYRILVGIGSTVLFYDKIKAKLES